MSGCSIYCFFFCDFIIAGFIRIQLAAFAAGIVFYVSVFCAGRRCSFCLHHAVDMSENRNFRVLILLVSAHCAFFVLETCVFLCCCFISHPLEGMGCLTAFFSAVCTSMPVFISICFPFCAEVVRRTDFIPSFRYHISGEKFITRKLLAILVIAKISFSLKIILI